MVVERWGTGRRDNSTNTEASVDPTPRSYQTTAFDWDLIYVPAYTFITTESELLFAENADTHHIHYVSLTADANVLIEAELLDENGNRIFHDYGYQSIEYEFPHGVPVKKLTIKIINWSKDTDIYVAYSHNGVQNTKTMKPDPMWLVSW